MVCVIFNQMDSKEAVAEVSRVPIKEYVHEYNGNTNKNPAKLSKRKQV
jgi:hypothetical protein